MHPMAVLRTHRGGAILALLLVAVLVAACQAEAATAALTVPISPVAGQQAHGDAILRAGPGANQYTVTVTMEGLSPGQHPEHIHQGVCPNPGPIVVPLTTLNAGANGRATATTTVNGSLSSVTDGHHSINVHQANLAQVACGTIPK
jgi:uncharacterized protein (DUF2126 family)